MSTSVTVKFVLCILLIAIQADGQDRLRGELFGDVDQQMQQAREKKVDLYSPTNFSRAQEYYKQADEDYKKGKNLEDIRAKLRGTASYLRQALEATKLAEVTFGASMSARTDAISAGAPTHATELWNKAENQFKSAAKQLEDGDVNDARKDAGLAEASYRSAELEAIKTNYLAPARELLRRADELDVADYAPKTLARARKLADEVELLLKQNRYDTDEARQLAQDSRDEAAHAIYLNEAIKRLRRDGGTLEDALLMAEPPLQRVAGALDIAAQFDAGTEPVVKQVTEEILRREKKAAADEQSIQRLQEELATVKQQVAAMEGRLGTLTEAERALQTKLDHQRRQEETISNLSSLFDYDEGNVLRDGNSIVIRLYGLTFPVGKSTIETQFYPLLAKVQDAIRQFPNSQLVIEGHTDSQGGDEANMILSEQRAQAVAEYLRANMGTVLSMNAYGYGETRPVASNDTNEGRAKNRRIDVVIIPEWAMAGR